ncbi:cupin domain-containing protein [Streptomyces sp. NPDC054849]
MIVSTATGDVAVVAGPVRAKWQSLIRRGMLYSECEGVEYWDLPAGAVLPVRTHDGTEEAVLVLSGAIALHDGQSPPTPAGPGQVLLLPHGTQGELHTHGGASTLVVVRALPGPLARRLPPRLPELPASKR